ncbi:MAG: ferritin-like domain-containing protein [Sphingomonas sp.]|uniref:ferritin-like domain-containing protein n=1 Tax=Sphingomonas sp. TaxID=28214 RepID=UPI003562F752
MTDTPSSEQLVAAIAQNRAERRRFLVGASRTGLALGTVALLDACGGGSSGSGTATPTPTDTSVTPTPTSTSVAIDQNAFNFLINLEYLTAQFYALASTGTGLSATLLTGTGTQGSVTGGRAVTFTDPIVAQYARELAADDLAHVGLLRSILGAAVVAQPAINIDGGASGAFTTAMLNAGVIGSGTFDPYASDENFLLAAYFLSDVVVTAYKGASLLVTGAATLPPLVGMMAAEAYHAGLIRTTLYAKGVATPSLRTNAGLISDYRDSLDGTTTDDDQGITGSATASNIAPTDANGFAFTRTAGQALNIFYLTKSAVVGGGFFPAGLNGVTKTSAAS